MAYELKVIKEIDVDCFNKKITQHLNDGWKLKGNLRIIPILTSICFIRELYKE